MSTCIYCNQSEPNVTFDSEEHVFPAGIGGVFTLPKGAVCDECNGKKFSKLELDFNRNSFIALPRQFYGPGKRGSLNPLRATSSNVHLMVSASDSTERVLGLMRKGAPYQIPQFRIHGATEATVVLDPRDGEVENQLALFVERMRAFQPGDKFVFTTDEILASDDILFGFHDGKYYLCARSREHIDHVHEYLDSLRRGQFHETGERRARNEIVQSRQQLAFDMDGFARVCSKIAFNALYFRTSRAYCSDPKFNPIKDFICRGGQNDFTRLLTQGEDALNHQLNLAFPALSHRVFFLSLRQNGFLALLNFYGNVNILIKLATEGPPEIFEGIICDWQNRKDMNLHDYLKRFSGE